MSYVKQNFKDGDVLHASQLNAMDDVIEGVAPLTEGGEFVLTPTEYVANSVYNVATRENYGDRAAFKHAFYEVTAGETYYITGSSAANPNVYPLCAFWGTKSNYRISIHGTDKETQYADYEITAPEGAVRMVVNSTFVGEEIKVYTRTQIIEALKDYPTVAGNVTGLKQTAQELTERVAHGFSPRNSDAVILQMKRNPPCWKPFDSGYVTFVFDDLLDAVDGICATFEEYNFPIVLAAIPARLNITAKGLQADRGSYTVGMTMRQICHTVESLGGEIMAHNINSITADNQSDVDFMYDYFIHTKDILLQNSYNIRGIIRAGGTNQISRSKEIERYLIAEYEYSDMGYTAHHRMDRVTINQPVEDIKAAILNAKNTSTWLRFYGHDYDYGDYFTSEAVLREILDYCVSVSIPVVTCMHMYDTFASTYLEEALNGNS